LFVTGKVAGQNACYFTTMPSMGPLNTFYFTPAVVYSQPQYYTFWDFGDGTYANNDSGVAHTYSLPGYYVVCRTVYDSLGGGGMVCQYCDSLTITTVPCSFYYQTTPGSLLATFYAQPSVQGSYIYWSFDGGISFVGPGPVYTQTFTAPGNYTVIMSERDSSGVVLCTDTNVASIATASSCNFTYYPDSMQQSTVHFTANVSLPGSSYVIWSFGDGSYDSSSTSVSHTYASQGYYTVCLNVFDSLGTTICTSCDSVFVGQGQGWNCSFTSTQDSVNSFLFHFNAQVNPGAVVTWDFGDGNSGTGINTSHFYNSWGTFIVVMTAVDSSGMPCMYTSMVTVGGSGTCTYTSIQDSLNSMLFYFFSNPTQGASIVWDFGDSTFGSGSFASHQYAAAGTYMVCMNVLDSAQNVICTSCMPLHVSSSSPNCTSYYLATTLGLTGYFIDLSNFDPSSSTYYWSFGDNTSSTSRFPSHTYSTPGTYNACLTVSGSGCTDQYCSTVTVDTLVNSPVTCQAFFAKLQLAPYQVAIINLSSGINLNFNWDFGDGTTSNLPYPAHYYNSTGTYTVCLTVSDTGGCSDTYCDTLTVDSSGYISLTAAGFMLNVLSPAQITCVNDMVEPLHFAVYPNPVKSIMNIDMADGIKEEFTLKIYSIEGRLIQSNVINDRTTNWNLEELPQGVYIVEINDSNGNGARQRIIKQ
jgi:PKD repeat protein